MTMQTVNIGKSVNDGTGDPLRSALKKIVSNFKELYMVGSDGTTTIPVPATATGISGDYKGKITYNDEFIYICVLDYTGNDSKIWRRVAISTYTTLVSSPPKTSKGVSGDYKGKIISDTNHTYICVLDYTNGMIDIWRRIATPPETWPT